MTRLSKAATEAVAILEAAERPWMSAKDALKNNVFREDDKVEAKLKDEYGEPYIGTLTFGTVTEDAEEPGPGVHEWQAFYDEDGQEALSQFIDGVRPALSE